MSKFLFFITLMNLYLGTAIELPRADLIIFPEGEQISGHVQYVLEDIVNIDTKSGEQRIIRNLRPDEARDIVETGIINSRRQSGRIRYFDEYELVLETYTGKVVIKRPLIRKIIIAQETEL